MALQPNRRQERNIAALIIAAFVTIFAFLPIANWIPGGHEAATYSLVASGWLSGSAIVVGLGIVFGILSGKLAPLWREHACDGVISAWCHRPLRSSLILAGTAFVLYCIIAREVFSGRPLLIDELAQTLHAQILASGRLSRPVFTYPGFFSTMHVVDTNGRYFSQFPVGGPAMLAIGVLIGAPWLIGPLFGAVAVIAYAAYARVAEPRPGVALGATLLFAFAPFVVFMSGSYMNHVTALTWVMIAIAAMAYVVTADAPRPWVALVSGLGFGIAATIRPVDALAFALPAGVWYLARALRDRKRWKDAIPAGIGVAVPVLLLLWVNQRTTGAPFLFGYELLWGKSHALGFHKAPWGMSHTPLRGVELINLYFMELQTYLFETPLPSLVPFIGALLLTRRLDRFDRYLFASSGLLVTLYWAYWHNGFYLGPRFMYLLMPIAALWTARFLPLVKDRFGAGLAYRSSVYGYLTAGAITAVILIPLRGRQYASTYNTVRWNADSAAAASNVRNAIVLVRESWGAQLIARMWALGVPRSETELLYWHVDACALEQSISRLEHDSIRGTAAVAELHPLLRDSSRTVASPFSPDTSEQYLPGSQYTARCVARIKEDRTGFTVVTPLLLDHGGNNIYARDMHGRDSLLARAYPGRPIYVVRPANAGIDTPPQFYRAPIDSLWAAWRSGDSLSILTAMGKAHDQQRTAVKHAASDSTSRASHVLRDAKLMPAASTMHSTAPHAPHY